MLNVSLPHTINDGVHDFLGERKTFISGGVALEIETDYQWDWQEDPKVSSCLVGEWKNLNFVMSENAFVDSKNVLIIGGGGKNFFEENFFPKYLDEMILVNPSLEELVETPVDRQSNLNLTLIRGIAEEIPLVDEAVDTVVVSSTLDHVCDVHKSLAEFARVLHPGGLLAITLGNTKSWYKKLFSFLHIPRPEDHAHNFHFDTQDVLSLLGAHGFVNIEYKTTAFLRLPRRVERVIAHINLVSLYLFLSNKILPRIIGKSGGGMLVVWARKPG